jgi:hypothetical protein
MLPLHSKAVAVCTDGDGQDMVPVNLEDGSPIIGSHAHIKRSIRSLDDEALGAGVSFGKQPHSQGYITVPDWKK